MDLKHVVRPHGSGSRPCASTEAAEEPLTGRARCLSDVAAVYGAILRPSWRSRIPARREGVLEANGVFSRLIGEGSGLREQSGGCRTMGVRNRR